MLTCGSTLKVAGEVAAIKGVTTRDAQRYDAKKCAAHVDFERQRRHDFVAA